MRSIRKIIEEQTTHMIADVDIMNIKQLRDSIKSLMRIRNQDVDRLAELEDRLLVLEKNQNNKEEFSAKEKPFNNYTPRGTKVK